MHHSPDQISQLTVLQFHWLVSPAFYYLLSDTHAADEAGLLPEDLKRGVLSQDGINDLLDRFRDLKTHPTHAEQLVQLYFDQKQTLDLFLERGAISKAQYDISLKELTDKLQIDKLTE